MQFMYGIPSCRIKVRLLSALAGLVTSFLSTQAATLTVTNANDQVPAAPGSLRQAILDANLNPGNDDIAFNISGGGPFTINLVAPLPSITETVVIDGATQPGYTGRPRIELNGVSAGGSASGLYLLAPNCVVRGLAIDRFAREGIRIETYGSNIIQGNFIGVGFHGTNSLGNGSGASGFGGVTILSAGNMIGGIEASNRNVISGGNKHGIFLLNSTASGNQIQGNLIGTDVTGTKRLGNLQNGIVISGGAGNQIGGSDVGARNVISGNSQSGVYLNPGSTSNLVQGNFIGTDANGSAAVSNAADGVTISGAVGNLVGGTSAALRNVISGNGGRGVFINAGGAAANLIQGNFIGTDANGTNKLANTFSGVEIFRASSNMVGGTISGARNVISGNKLSGVAIDDSNSSANVIQGNFIGTDFSGTNALGNERNGVFVSGVSHNLIGGSIAGAGNVISANLQNGLHLVDVNCTSNIVQGNFVGTDFTGTRRLGNGIDGVQIEAPGNSIGGTSSETRNLISANTRIGVYVTNLIATGNVIQGNYVGTDATGTTALGNLQGGIYITRAPSNQIGGAVAGAGNLVSGNSGPGIAIGDTGANGNWVAGNFIGTGADGITALGNAGHGVDIAVSSNDNIIGGVTSAEANRIAFATISGFDGVRIRDGCTRNLVRGNSIFANGGSSVNGLGIDLGLDGVTTNDPCDEDSGGNLLQNFPVLTSVYTGASTWIRGTLNSVANKTYLLEFYANAFAESSGYGEGQTFLGDAYVTTGGSCTQNFTVVLPKAAPVGQLLAVTATDPSNNTSEFSAAVSVAPQPELIPVLAVATSQLTLSWTNTAAGFVLQQATNLSPPIVWLNVTNAPVAIGGQYVVTLATETGSRFFRLTLP